MYGSYTQILAIGSRSIRNLQITTDCSVFDRFCFRVLFAYCDESMASKIVYKP